MGVKGAFGGGRRSPRTCEGAARGHPPAAPCELRPTLSLDGDRDERLVALTVTGLLVQTLQLPVLVHAELGVGVAGGREPARRTHRTGRPGRTRVPVETARTA